MIITIRVDTMRFVRAEREANPPRVEKLHFWWDGDNEFIVQHRNAKPANEYDHILKAIPGDQLIVVDHKARPEKIVFICETEAERDKIARALVSTLGVGDNDVERIR